MPRGYSGRHYTAGSGRGTFNGGKPGSRGRGMVDDGALGVPEGRAWLARRNSHRAALSHTPIVNGGAAGSRVWWCTMWWW